MWWQTLSRGWHSKRAGSSPSHSLKLDPPRKRSSQARGFEVFLIYVKRKFTSQIDDALGNSRSSSTIRLVFWFDPWRSNRRPLILRSIYKYTCWTCILDSFSGGIYSLRHQVFSCQKITSCMLIYHGKQWILQWKQLFFSNCVKTMI